MHKVFQSSNIYSGDYDPPTQILTLYWRNGTHDKYANVPPEVWARLSSAVSPGGYFHSMIKPTYPRLPPDKGDST